MKTRTDIVQTLGELTVTDRKWIVDRLSPTARKALLDERAHSADRDVAIAAATARSASTATVSNESEGASSLQSAARKIDRAHVDSVAAVLTRESAWVIHALLQHQAWSWRADLQRKLSARMRDELSRLESAAPCFTPKVIERLVILLAAQLQTVTTAAPTHAPTLSRFEKLVGGFGTRLARQRLRVRT